MKRQVEVGLAAFRCAPGMDFDAVDQAAHGVDQVAVGRGEVRVGRDGAQQRAQGRHLGRVGLGRPGVQGDRRRGLAGEAV
ncbi:hypothetical protein [Phenylobacterium sp.]|uniref:hypothetical protein n=1 Tax=Phenylobacterium sp. TaxID=1871053 RepID=UPI0035B26398